jgi:hypothetical protein
MYFKGQFDMDITSFKTVTFVSFIAFLISTNVTAATPISISSSSVIYPNISYTLDEVGRLTTVTSLEISGYGFWNADITYSTRPNYDYPSYSSDFRVTATQALFGSLYQGGALAGSNADYNDLMEFDEYYYMSHTGAPPSSGNEWSYNYSHSWVKNIDERPYFYEDGTPSMEDSWRAWQPISFEINDHVLDGYFSQGNYGYVTWTATSPVPEPSSLFLFTAGIGLLGWRVKRKR